MASLPTCLAALDVTAACRVLGGLMARRLLAGLLVLSGLLVLFRLLVASGLLVLSGLVALAGLLVAHLVATGRLTPGLLATLSSSVSATRRVPATCGITFALRTALVTGLVSAILSPTVAIVSCHNQVLPW